MKWLKITENLNIRREKRKCCCTWTLFCSVRNFVPLQNSVNFFRFLCTSPTFAVSVSVALPNLDCFCLHSPICMSYEHCFLLRNLLRAVYFSLPFLACYCLTSSQPHTHTHYAQISWIAHLNIFIQKDFILPHFSGNLSCAQLDTSDTPFEILSWIYSSITL